MLFISSKEKEEKKMGKLQLFLLQKLDYNSVLSTMHLLLCNKQ